MHPIVHTRVRAGARLSLMLVVAALAACTDTPAAPNATRVVPPIDAVTSASAGKAGKIAFINRVIFDQWLYIMNADGSDLTRVHDVPSAYEADPTWSPDYKSVLYIDYNGNHLKRYTLANGRTEIVYAAPGSITHPRYSPDGKRIAFDMALAGSTHREVYFMNADGTGLNQFTSSQYSSRHPTWSPDGTRIAFETLEGGGGAPRIYVKNIDGSNGHAVANCDYSGLPGYCLSPSWSPVPGDERIAFAAVAVDSYTSLRFINADGTGDTSVISDATVLDKEPSWSRDGTKLAFRSKLAGTSEPGIYSINTNGTGLRQLTPPIGEARSPAWAR